MEIEVKAMADPCEVRTGHRSFNLLPVATRMDHLPIWSTASLTVSI